MQFLELPAVADGKWRLCRAKPQKALGHSRAIRKTAAPRSLHDGERLLVCSFDPSSAAHHWTEQGFAPREGLCVQPNDVAGNFAVLSGKTKNLFASRVGDFLLAELCRAPHRVSEVDFNQFVNDSDI